MSATDQIRDLLHQIASLLAWPVLLGLLLLTLAMLVSFGAFLREFWQRRTGVAIPNMKRDEEGLRLIGTVAGDDLDLRLEEYLQKAELRRWRSLGRLRLAMFGFGYPSDMAVPKLFLDEQGNCRVATLIGLTLKIGNVPEKIIPILEQAGVPVLNEISLNSQSCKEWDQSETGLDLIERS